MCQHRSLYRIRFYCVNQLVYFISIDECMSLKELRQKANLRVEDVAARLGVAFSTVRNWDQGRTIPNLNPMQYVELLKLYNCSPEELAAAVQPQRESE